MKMLNKMTKTTFLKMQPSLRKKIDLGLTKKLISNVM